MSRKTNIMSDKLKEEIAKELGVYETVKNESSSFRHHPEKEKWCLVC